MKTYSDEIKEAILTQTKSKVSYLSEIKKVLREQHLLAMAYKREEEIKLERIVNGRVEIAEIFSTTTYQVTDSKNRLRSYGSIEELHNDGWLVQRVS